MTHTSFTGLLSRKKVVRYLIYLLFVCVFAVFVFKLNQVEKTELVVRTGQTFEKAEVTEILQDNLDSNGTRVGEQKVHVKMLTGARKGEELDVTSSSGYLFGAACTVRNESHCHAECCRRDHDRQRLLSGSRMGHLYFCPALSSRIVRHWRQAGNQRMPWTDLHFFLCDLCLSSACVSAFFTVLGRCFYLFSHHTGHYVPHRRSYKKDLCSDTWYTGRCCSGRSFRLVLQQSIRDFRLQCI